MTIKEYLDGMPPMQTATGQTMADAMAETVSIWSNDACKGYCIDAMQEAGLDREQIRTVLACMHYSFDMLTVEEAERLYIGF